jgi:hypothetical protein
MSVISGSSASASACAVKPARLSHAGACVRTSQSAAMSERRASKAFDPRVPTRRGMSGRSNALRSSADSPSFQARMNALITGHAHSG